MTEKTISAGTATLDYDYENRLVKITYPDSGTTELVYDALGRRLKMVEKDAGGATLGVRHYMYDGLDLIAELDEDDDVEAAYTHGPGVDDPLIVRYNGNDYFYQTNHQGSVTELMNADGYLAKRYRYDAFGNIISETGPMFNRGFTYTSRERHARSGFYYYRARFYDPQTGRFITPDPIAHLGGVNLYAYVGNSPVNWVDPNGLTIVVRGDLNAYWQAIAYLWRDPGMRATITDLTLSKTTYTVITNNIGDDRYIYSRHEIHWDPNSALRCRRGRGSQSPALGLGHEMAHANYPWSGKLLGVIPSKDYDNLEERRVITGPEADAARTLGEDVRTSHRGVPFWVPTPTSR